MAGIINNCDNDIEVNGNGSKIKNLFLNADFDLQEANKWKEKLNSILQNIPSKANTCSRRQLGQMKVPSFLLAANGVIFLPCQLAGC